ncbi:MAG: hypothetical protein EA412_09090 [Chitinophagaceae bacterium]|nr:MAG: hypothetical protein EA412_09090 [Chitinophagaceae bacterium]
MSEAIFDIMKITIPAIIVFATAYFVTKKILETEYKKIRLEMQIARQKEGLPVRLQAYERLSLFIERISPVNLVQRIRQPQMTSKQMQMALISSIRAEYEHNITQQIYVSPQLWAEICLIRDDVVKLVNMSASELPENAGAKDLSRILLTKVMEEEDSFSKERVVEIMKKEVKELFG